MAITLALTGCADDGKAAPPSAVPTTSPSLTPEKAVRAAYTAFWPNTLRALTGPTEEIQPTLARYATGGYLVFQVKSTKESKELGRIPWGSGPVVRIVKVQITAGKATVRDCQDASQAGLANSSTKQLIPGTRGTSRTGFKADLERGSDGQWRLSGLKRDTGACSLLRD
ncbi:hypothetical protein [Actinomadura sp. 6N118]|uniref:hypothetical protein n=1 Tax=Actinomadura sp. 6N118 TaxID=3375151 RepID=UPI00378D777E